MEFLITLILWIILELYMKYVSWREERREKELHDKLDEWSREYLNKRREQQIKEPVDFRDFEIMPTREGK